MNIAEHKSIKQRVYDYEKSMGIYKYLHSGIFLR